MFVTSPLKNNIPLFPPYSASNQVLRELVSTTRILQYGDKIGDKHTQTTQSIVLVQTRRETRLQTIRREYTLLSYSSIPQAPTPTYWSLYFNVFIMVIPAPRKMTASEIRSLEYDCHFNSTSGASFRSDHSDLCIGVVQIMTGKASEIFCSSLGDWVGGRDSMDKRMRKGCLNKAWCNVRRNVTKRVMFLIHLQ